MGAPDPVELPVFDQPRKRTFAACLGYSAEQLGEMIDGAAPRYLRPSTVLRVQFRDEEEAHDVRIDGLRAVRVLGPT